MPSTASRSSWRREDRAGISRLAAGRGGRLPVGLRFWALETLGVQAEACSRLPCWLLRSSSQRLCPPLHVRLYCKISQTCPPVHRSYGFWVNSGYLKNGAPHVLTITSRGGTRLQTTITSVWRAQVGVAREGGGELCGRLKQAASSRLHQPLIMRAHLAGPTSSAFNRRSCPFSSLGAVRWRDEMRQQPPTLVCVHGASLHFS